MDDLMMQFIQQEIAESIATKQRLLQDNDLLSDIKTLAEKCIQVYDNGGTIMLAGNGGSAADAQHIAAELVNQLCFDRPALSAFALSTDTSILTCIGNDRSFDEIYSRQIEANAREGDLFIGISTSGNSKNILSALNACAKKGVTTVGWTGSTGGAMLDICDYCLTVPSTETPRIQESHILIGHMVCSIIENHFFKTK